MTPDEGHSQQDEGLLRLYSYYRSSAAYRVRIALHLKGIPYTQTAVDLAAGEQGDASYLAVNAQGLIPALRLADGTVLNQSMAIIEWLETEYPQPPLYPHDALQCARARGLVGTIVCDIHPLNNLRVLQYLSGKLGASDTQRSDWYQHWIGRGFGFLESQIIAAPYALGDAPGVVDVCLVPQVYNALRFAQDMSAYPKIASVYAACLQRAEFQAAAPQAQPGAG